MKYVIMTICLMACLLLTGCWESFAGGVAVGHELAVQAEKDLLETLAELDAETERINEVIETAKDIDLSPVTKEAIKNRADDPVFWVALASVLGNALGVGRLTVGKGKK